MGGVAGVCVDKTKVLQEEVEAERKERHSSPRHSHGDSPYLGRSSNRSKGNKKSGLAVVSCPSCGAHLFLGRTFYFSPLPSHCPFDFLFYVRTFLDLVALQFMFCSTCTSDFLLWFILSSLLLGVLLGHCFFLCVFFFFSLKKGFVLLFCCCFV